MIEWIVGKGHDGVGFEERMGVADITISLAIATGSIGVVDESIEGGGGVDRKINSWGWSSVAGGRVRFVDVVRKRDMHDAQWRLRLEHHGGCRRI